jgi:DNA primase
MPADFRTFKEELLSRVSVVDVVGRKVPLKPKGKDFWGCCPFHNEKTPSFSVNEEKGYYHCFGCGAHGDAITFEMKVNNLNFMEACEVLASSVGMEVPTFKPVDPERGARAANYLEIMEIAAETYSKSLFDADAADGLNYLYNRGITDEIIKQFRIGFAPRGNILTKRLSDKERALLYSTELIRKSNSGDGDYDFFRGRIMFPIFDPKGHIIAFSGRAMGDEQPKYINTGETEFFHKRRNLYGLNFARKVIGEKKRAIVVEGQIDSIQMQFNGFGETVAPLGSALTEEHIEMLLKITKQIIFCFDGDTAGKKAAARAVDIIMPFLRSDIDVKILTLSGGKDPDEILRKMGAEYMEKMMMGAAPLVDYLWGLANSSFQIQTPNGQAEAIKFLKAHTDKIKDEILRIQIEKTFRDLQYKDWRSKTVVAPKIDVPKISNPEELKLSAICAAYPELYDKYFEFLAGYNINLNAVPVKISLEQAEKNIKILKLRKYINDLQSELAETVKIQNPTSNAMAEHIREEISKAQHRLESELF